MARDSGRVILMPKGDYVATTTYVALDWVRYDGRAWVCKQSCLGQVPHNGVYWQVLAQDGSVGEVPWSSVITKPFNSVGTDGLKVTENVLDVDFSKVQKPLENVSETAEDIADTDVMLVGAKKSLWSNIKSKILAWLVSEYMLDSGALIKNNSTAGYFSGALGAKALFNELNSDLTPVSLGFFDILDSCQADVYIAGFTIIKIGKVMHVSGMFYCANTIVPDTPVAVLKNAYKPTVQSSTQAMYSQRFSSDIKCCFCVISTNGNLNFGANSPTASAGEFTINAEWMIA